MIHRQAQSFMRAPAQVQAQSQAYAQAQAQAQDRTRNPLRPEQLRRYNRYQDVEIDASLLPHDQLGKFLAALSEEESKWVSRLSRRVDDHKIRMGALFWVKVSVQLSHLLPPLLANNVFTVHHATSEYIMLVKSPGDMGPPSPPSYGTHYSRVECLVLDESNGTVLIVNERIGTMSSCKKLVTGSVEAGEYISTAAEREIMEETGIKAQFKGIIGVVNRIGTRFGRDELLLGCLLVASPPGQTPHPRSAEIVSAEWVPSSELMASGSNYMGRRWACSAANLALQSSHPNGLEERIMEDFRGHNHDMKMYSAL